MEILKVMPNQLLATESYSHATREEWFIDKLIENWKFYAPTTPVITGILRLREKLGDSYLENEYHRSSSTESEEHAKEVKALESEVAKKKNGFELLLSQVAGILLGRERVLADPEESIAEQQSLISQRIYNHMAMLGSTPRTLRGEAFSIHKELTEGIAEKIGLGLYLSPHMNKELRQETETVLLQLAGEYQDWLIQKTWQGPLQTTWGYICLVGQKLTEEQRATYPLILVADVARARVAT